jgi:hypothetical protein
MAPTRPARAVGNDNQGARQATGFQVLQEAVPGIVALVGGSAEADKSRLGLGGDAPGR